MESADPGPLADYGDPTAEYQAVRESAGLLDRASRSFIRVSGPDRFSWLQGMVSNDVMRVGSDVESLPACILDSTGHLLADLTVVYAGEDLLLDLDRERIQPAYDYLDQFLIMEDVRLAVESRLACLSVQGPDATHDVIRGWTETHPESRAVPADHTGEGGFDVYVPTTGNAEGKGAAWDYFLRLGIRPVGESAAEMLRIEAGIPKYGVDMDESTIPLEAGLGPTHISYTKGCYVGQEIIHRIYSRGHTNRALTGFRVEGSGKPAPGEKLFESGIKSGKEVGRLTSVAYSPTLHESIALGYLRNEVRKAGAVLRTETSLTVTVTDLPFVKGRGLR